MSGMRVRAWVGVGVAAIVLAPFAVLAGQAQVARSRSYVQPSEAPAVAGDFGPESGDPVNLVILGDSTGAGLGATSTTGTVGGQLAAALAAAGHRVHLIGLAVSGARVAGVPPQVDRLEALHLTGRTVVMLLIGVNDATHLTGLTEVRTRLADVLTRLSRDGARVVLATSPDIGAARNFAQPLRTVAAWRGRGVARAEEEAAAGVPDVTAVALSVDGPAFRRDPSLLSRDLFHPSDAGYALWAKTLAPAVLRAAG